MNDDVETLNENLLRWHLYRMQLERLRTQAGLRQQDVAERIGVNASTVSRWLTNAPKTATWANIHRFVAVSIEAARAQDIVLNPPEFGDVVYWHRSFWQVLGLEFEEPVQPGQMQDGKVRDHDRNPSPAEPWSRRYIPRMTIFASPLVAMSVLAFLAIAVTCSVTYGGATAPQTSVTSSPAPSLNPPSPYEDGLRDRFSRPLPAGRGTPRPSLSPSTAATTDPAHDGTALCALTPPLAAGERDACASIVVSPMPCPEPTSPAAGRHTKPVAGSICFLVRIRADTEK
ncbi:helix-turn-helix domain-containing protein [Streptomyces sp. NPDC002659]|uniref:helix-turn-helix domain-containing protein n=1 Tax=Streptomyces sp. NPDC002659 TaxID=3364656 RepID=UPI003692F0F4